VWAMARHHGMVPRSTHKHTSCLHMPGRHALRRRQVAGHTHGCSAGPPGCACCGCGEVAPCVAARGVVETSMKRACAGRQGPLRPPLATHNRAGSPVVCAVRRRPICACTGDQVTAACYAADDGAQRGEHTLRRCVVVARCFATVAVVQG
jgi:hypothetical protein